MMNSATSNLTTTINSQIVPAFDKLHIEQQKSVVSQEAFLDKDEKVAIIEKQIIKKTPVKNVQNGNGLSACENGAC